MTVTFTEQQMKELGYIIYRRLELVKEDLAIAKRTDGQIKYWERELSVANELYSLISPLSDECDW